MRFPISLLPFFLLAFAFSSCNKEEYRSDPAGSPVTVTFAGRITDDFGAPLSGASVEAGASSAVTDANGVFFLAPATLPSRNAILTVKHSGFFDFSRAYLVHDKGLQSVNIQLLKRQVTQTFDAAQGATIQSGDVRIEFKANSIATAGGSAYSGTVNVYARYLDPEDTNLSRRMPGDLRGLDASGETRTLTTYGMIGVELATPGGDPLQLADGYEATITLPIPAGQQTAAPAEIPLWHFDLSTARWIEEGSAQRSGDQYVGKVRHFTFWNFDTGAPAVHLSGRAVIGNDQKPLDGALVQLTIPSSGYTSFAFTDANGNFGGFVPQGEVMQLDVIVYGACANQTLYTQTVGPFNQDAILPLLVLSGANLQVFTLSGRLLNCNQQAVEKGYVLASSPSSASIIFTAPDGTFEKTLINCNPGEGVSITGYDFTAQQKSELLTFPDIVADIQTGDIPVCIQTTDEFATVIFNGVTYTFTAPFYTNYSDAFDTNISKSGDTNFLIIFSGFEKTGPSTLQWLSVTNAGGTLLSSHHGTNTITHYGAVGDYISGYFSGTAQAPDGQTYPVSGVYQVIRDL